MSVEKLIVTSITKRNRNNTAAILSLLGAALFALSIGGCAETYYAESYPTLESRYDTYHGPYFYPYYPYHSYYGGAYYSGD